MSRGRASNRLEPLQYLNCYIFLESLIQECAQVKALTGTCEVCKEAMSRRYYCCSWSILYFEVITSCLLYLYTKSSCAVMKNISNKFHQGALVTTIVFGDFCRQSIKLEKMTNFFKFQSMPILAIRYNRRLETVSVPKYSLQQQNLTIIFFKVN